MIQRLTVCNGFIKDTAWREKSFPAGTDCKKIYSTGIKMPLLAMMNRRRCLAWLKLSN